MTYKLYNVAGEYKKRPLIVGELTGPDFDSAVARFEQEIGLGLKMLLHLTDDMKITFITAKTDKTYGLVGTVYEMKCTIENGQGHVVGIHKYVIVESK